jgi:hypothetical protein
MNQQDQQKMLAKVLRVESLTSLLVPAYMRPAYVAIAFDLVVQGRLCPDELLGEAVAVATIGEKKQMADLVESNRIPSAVKFARQLSEKYSAVLYPPADLNVGQAEDYDLLEGVGAA